GGTPTRHAVGVHGVHVEPIGGLLGDDEPVAVGAELHLGGSDVRAREGECSARDRRERAARSHREARDVAVSARVQHVQHVPVPVPPVATVVAAVRVPSAARLKTATALPATWLVSVYTAPGPERSAETLASRAASNDAAGPVRLRFGSHAASAAAANARKARCFGMERNLPRVVDEIVVLGK